MSERPFSGAFRMYTTYPPTGHLETPIQGTLSRTSKTAQGWHEWRGYREIFSSPTTGGQYIVSVKPTPTPIPSLCPYPSPSPSAETLCAMLQQSPRRPKEAEARTGSGSILQQRPRGPKETGARTGSGSMLLIRSQTPWTGGDPGGDLPSWSPHSPTHSYV